MRQRLHPLQRSPLAWPQVLRRMAALVVMVASGAAMAQPSSFPDKPVRIVPFGTGGGPIDIIARLYGEKLQQRWGQTVIVEAKPGASGILATDAVAKAVPDGHTVMITLSLTHVNVPILHAGKLPYDPVRDFEPLSQLAIGGPMVVAPLNAPYNTLREFVEWAKTRPSVTYGTWGNGSAAHLYGELLARQTGIKLIHVPYKAEAAAHSDMLGGQLDTAWANPATARNQASKMKALGIAAKQRVSTLPSVPTFAEQGFSGFDLESWIGAYAPAKTPQPVLDKWVAALREITKMPDVQARLVAMGFEPMGNGPKEFAANVKADYAPTAELIKAAGVTLE